MSLARNLRKSAHENTSIEVDSQGNIRRKKAGEYARPWRDAMRSPDGQFDSMTDVGQRKPRNSSLTSSHAKSPKRERSGMRKFTSEGSLPPATTRAKHQVDYLAEMRLKRKEYEEKQVSVSGTGSPRKRWE